MIRTRQDLIEYIKADHYANQGGAKNDKALKQYIRKILGWWGEWEFVRQYMRILRHYEYHLNNSNNNLYHKIVCKYYFSQWHRMSMKTGIHIPPNTVGKGFRISHYVGGVIINCFKMGEFCSVASGVVVGNKDSNENRATIGNYVKLTLGSKVIGRITIGDNVIVAPNSVVIKDVESDTIVSGIPAKVIKKKNT